MQKGKFELAHGGTLFLDEIGEMPLNLQVKLLRVLQEGTFTRVGGEKEIEADVRIIAATNRNLAEEVEAKTFREDLYYRLNVIPITLPPLRERLGDIPALMKFFHDRFCERHELPALQLTSEVIEKASNHAWPGNIRELQNAVEKAVILQDTSLLTGSMRPIGEEPGPPRAEQLPITPSRAERERQAAQTPVIDEQNQCVIDLGDPGAVRELADVAADAQRAALVRALRVCGGNKAEAAKKLGVSYKTLFNRIHELGISISTSVE